MMEVSFQDRRHAEIPMITIHRIIGMQEARNIIITVDDRIGLSYFAIIHIHLVILATGIDQFAIPVFLHYHGQGKGTGTIRCATKIPLFIQGSWEVHRLPDSFP